MSASRISPTRTVQKPTRFQMAQQFSENPQSNHDRMQITRLRCLTNIKLRTESAQEEPRLGRLLAHLNIYDSVRDWTPCDSQDITDAKLIPDDSSSFEQEPNELQTYLYHQAQQQQQHVPSFQDFQAAIQVQLATMAKVTATAAQITVEEYHSDDDDDASSVSSYNSYDGDEFSDDEGTTAASEGSLTDVETLDAECGSPVSECSFGEEDEDDEIFVLSPLTPLMATSVHF